MTEQTIVRRCLTQIREMQTATATERRVTPTTTTRTCQSWRRRRHRHTDLLRQHRRRRPPPRRQLSTKIRTTTALIRPPIIVLMSLIRNKPTQMRTAWAMHAKTCSWTVRASDLPSGTSSPVTSSISTARFPTTTARRSASNGRSATATATTAFAAPCRSRRSPDRFYSRRRSWSSSRSRVTAATPA